MIVYLTGDEKQSCRKLWEEAFPEDSREFGDYYFREKLKDNRILALVEEAEEEQLGIQEIKARRTGETKLSGNVQAMLHRNPYRLMVCGQQWQVDYLVGVATRKERRHRGYMRQLLLRMMDDMRREGMPFCFLMPADEAIYRPFGFTFIFRQPWFELTERGQGLRTERWIPYRGEISSQVMEKKESEKKLAVLSGWMNQWLANHYQVYAVRDEEYLSRLAKELASEEGTLDVFFDGDRIVAVESWWGSTQQERRLLYGEEPYVKTVDAEEKPVIMARIICPEEFVRVIRLRKKQQEEEEMTVSLRLRDPLIAENDGTWLWHLNGEKSWLERAELNGEESRLGRAELNGEESRLGRAELNGETDLTLTIEELTAWLFGYQVPAEAGKFADRIETLERVFLDEIV